MSSRYKDAELVLVSPPPAAAHAVNKSTDDETARAMVVLRYPVLRIRGVFISLAFRRCDGCALAGDETR
jgi:hypothetical protein